jgi:hypothetical protein
MRKSFFIGISFLFIMSCQYDPYAHLYLTKEPTKKNVVGVYKFKFQTMDSSIDDEKIKKRNTKITIFSDQTYSVDKLPYFKEIDVFNYTYDRSVSFSGTWKIETLGTVSYGGDHSEKHWGIILESAPKELRFAGLLGEKKPNGLIFSYGDPDQGKVMLLEQVD